MGSNLALPCMTTLTPARFHEIWGRPFEPQDHHFTGPIIAQQPECNGSVFHEEGRILATLAFVLGGPCLEIGSDLGISSRYIREGLPDDTRLFCIDIYHKWDSRAYDPRIEQFHMRAEDFIPPEKCIWAFIDGDHRKDAVLLDIKSALRCGCRVLIFHDCSPTMPAAKSASEGSNARDAVLESEDLKGWDLFDITTHGGMILATCPK